MGIKKTKLHSCHAQTLISNFCGLPPPRSLHCNRSVHQLGTAVEQVVSSFIGRFSRLQLLIGLWQQIVGKPLCYLCQPSNIYGKTFYVKALNQTIAQEIDLMSDKIMESINQLPNIGSLKKIKIVT